MQLVLIALLALQGCQKEPDKLKLPSSTTDEQLAEKLKGLENLKPLDLSYTKITDAGLVHLKGLGNLKELDLSYCREITGAGFKSLQEALPGCDIK